MINGISGNLLPTGFPYKAIIENLCGSKVPPCLVGAIKLNETGTGSGPVTEQDISGDGGRGIMQLTSSYPKNWQDPTANISYAVSHFIIPAMNEWKDELQGDNLVRAIAATYNAGLGNAQAGHKIGDIDAYTTNRYGERCLQRYQALLQDMVE